MKVFFYSALAQLLACLSGGFAVLGWWAPCLLCALAGSVVLTAAIRAAIADLCAGYDEDVYRAFVGGSHD